MSAPKRYTEEIRAEAVRRYMAGESSPKIAADIGCTPCTVMDWVNRSFEHNTKRSDDKMENATKETPAAVGAATDVHKNNIETASKSRYHYDNTEAAFCQALLTTICELTDDIVTALGQADSVEAAQHAGMIKGLAMALEKALLSGEHER